MKTIKNNLAIITALSVVGVFSFVLMNGCKVPESIANKSGSQLWSENCNRCHNAPPSSAYNNDQWEAATEHMRQKALLTNKEVEKITAFLKGE